MSETCHFGYALNENCSVSEWLDEEEKRQKCVTELSDQDQELLWWRSGVGKAEMLQFV